MIGLGARSGQARRANKTSYYFLQPLVEGPMTQAAERAANDPQRPADALDYPGIVRKLDKRLK